MKIYHLRCFVLTRQSATKYMSILKQNEFLLRFGAQSYPAQKRWLQMANAGSCARSIRLQLSLEERNLCPFAPSKAPVCSMGRVKSMLAKSPAQKPHVGLSSPTRRIESSGECLWLSATFPMLPHSSAQTLSSLQLATYLQHQWGSTACL